MKTKEILDAMIAGTYDAKQVCDALLQDAKTLSTTRSCKVDSAVLACYKEQLQKYTSAYNKYKDYCAKQNIPCEHEEIGMLVLFRANPLFNRLFENDAPIIPRAMQAMRKEQTYVKVTKNINECFELVLERLRAENMTMDQQGYTIASEIALKVFLHPYVGSLSHLDAVTEAAGWRRFIMDALSHSTSLPHSGPLNRWFDLSLIEDMIVFFRLYKVTLESKRQEELAKAQNQQVAP